MSGSPADKAADSIPAADSVPAAEKLIEGAAAEEAEKATTFIERIRAMGDGQKFSLVASIGLALDGIRRLFTYRPKPGFENAPQEEKNIQSNQQLLGAAEAIGGTTWAVKILKDVAQAAEKAAERRL